MLHSYSAEINGSQLVWLDSPPVPLMRQRVLVVVEEVSENKVVAATARYQLADLAGRLQWRGDALASQRAQRDAW